MADTAYYQWDLGAERYRAASGRFVSRAAVRASLDSVLDVQMDRARAMSEDLVNGDLSLEGWRSGMSTSIKVAALEGASVAKGGWIQLTTDDYRWTTERIRTQLGFLQDMHDDLAYGRAPMDGTVASRAEMYVESGRSVQRAMEGRMAVDRGEELERNVGGDDETSCDGCTEASDMGWVEIGTLPEIGERDCLSRDRCWIVYKTGKADD